MRVSKLFGGERDRTVALFDIGSGSVGGALATLESDMTPTILSSHRIPLPFQEVFDKNRRKADMKRALDSAVERVAKEYTARRARGESLRPISRVYATLASLWYTSRTHIIKLSREESFTVSRHFLEDLLSEAKKRFLASASKEQRGDGTLVRLEQAVMHTVLNGYPTKDPYNKKAKRLEAAIYLSLVGTGVKESVLQGLSREFSASEISLHSFLLGAYFTARDLHPELDDVLVMDISAEATDIGLVRDGVLLETISFPWGRNYVLRALAEKLGTIPEEAYTMLRLEEGALKSPRVAEALGAVKTEWEQALARTCGELAEEERLPKHVLLVVRADLAPWFSSAVGSGACAPYTFTGEPFEVVLLGGNDISRKYALEKGVAFDPFLALEAIHFNRVEFA